MLPHVLRDVVIPSLTERRGRGPGDGYGLVVTPEFLREGSSVDDFLNPPFTLIGATNYARRRCRRSAVPAAPGADRCAWGSAKR